MTFLLTRNFLSSHGIGSVFLTMFLNQSENKSYGRSSVSAVILWKVSRAFSLREQVSVQKYFFKETNNVGGESNHDFEFRNSISAALDLTSKFAAELAFATINRFNYAGRRSDLYETGIELTYAVSKKLSLAAGVLTSTAQIKDGENVRPELFAKDTSEASVSAKYIF